MPYDPEKRRQWYEKNREREVRQAVVRARKGRQERQTVLNEYKLRNGCSKCGYKRCPEAIDFHHREKHRKSHNLSRMVKDCMPIKKILAEVLKCDLLCANCHREEEAAQRAAKVKFDS